jgi:hypothetical protein
MTSRYWPIYCIFLFALVGCVTAQPKQNGGYTPPDITTPTPIPATLPATVRNENEILAYALRYGMLSADEQKKEFALVMQAYNSNKDDLTNRMKAALVLSLPASRQRDNGRAIILLDDVQRDTRAESDTRAIAALLKEYVVERQKLEEGSGKLVQKLGEEQKRNDALQGKADALQQKADGLQQKLDELKNIEKALTNRDQAKPK